MRRSHAWRRDGRGAEQPERHPVNHVDSHGNHANRDWNHANDDRGVNRDPRIGDHHDNATAC